MPRSSLSGSQRPVPPALLQRMLSLHDFEAEARRHLPRPVFGYIAGAAEDNHSLQANRSVFEDYGFITRVLRDVSKRSQCVELFGVRYASPFGIAPMGLNALSIYRGDLVLARAAQRAGIVSVMSGASLIPLEEVARESPGTWFQAYLPGDTTRIDALLDRVQRAGFGALMVTVDIPVPGNRENNTRAGFTAPLRPSLRLAWDGITRPHWLIHTFARTLIRHGMPHFENASATRGAALVSSTSVRDLSARDNFTWQHLEHIRRRWRGPLVIKGLLSVEDAVQAKNLGVDAVVLSNHGGRQLDGAVSALQVLEAVVAALGPDYPVLIDGGFRRGAEVLKAIALGARMVLVGRPFNYAGAVAGETGVDHAIALLQAEIDRNLGMLGATDCAQLGPQHLLKRDRLRTDP